MIGALMVFLAMYKAQQACASEARFDLAALLPT